MVTIGHPTVRGGREIECARRLIDLVGSPRRSAQIYYGRWTHVPFLLERFTRFASDLDDDMKTTRDRVVV